MPSAETGGGIQAGIELAGRTLRYAEVVRPVRPGFRQDTPASGPRLLRMGACDFEFDVAEAVLDLAGPTFLETIAAAVHEIFENSKAERLCVAVHPWHATSFFAPLPEGMPAAEKFEQLRQEAAMLADARVARPVRVTATPIRTEALDDGRRFHWHHVLRVPESVHARVAHIARKLGEDVGHAFIDASGAAAAVASGLVPLDEQVAEAENPESVPFAIALGVYGARIEVAICRGRTWYFGHWAEAGDVADGAYFGAALLERLSIPISQVGRLFTYGDPPDRRIVAGLESLLRCESRPLDPLGLFRPARSKADPSALAAFAPCIGAALAA
jgi:hypothetical protein